MENSADILFVYLSANSLLLGSLDLVCNTIGAQVACYVHEVGSLGEQESTWAWSACKTTLGKYRVLSHILGNLSPTV